MNAKAKSYIGLAQRAGAVLYGEDKIAECKKPFAVVLVDEGANEEYKSRLIKKCSDSPVFVVEGLREAVHREQVLAVGVTNAELGKAILDQLR